MRLLVVDDDPKFRSYMLRGLGENEFECSAAESVDEALKQLGPVPPGPFDLVLLDVMMPGRPGWDLLEQIRSRGFHVPVVFLTARQGVPERLKGFDLGADDYVIKPFPFAELVARIRAVLRRRASLPTLAAGDLVLDLASRAVALDGRQVDLTDREFELLRALIEAKGAALSRKDLLRKVWKMDFDPGTNVVEVQVRRLRNKVGFRRILTIPSQGYCLVSEKPS